LDGFSTENDEERRRDVSKTVIYMERRAGETGEPFGPLAHRRDHLACDGRPQGLTHGTPESPQTPSTLLARWVRSLMSRLTPNPALGPVTHRKWLLHRADFESVRWALDEREHRGCSRITCMIGALRHMALLAMQPPTSRLEFVECSHNRLVHSLDGDSGEFGGAMRVSQCLTEPRACAMTEQGAALMTPQALQQCVSGRGVT
jgi:hypothetical protein